jgi:hypothetical protein
VSAWSNATLAVDLGLVVLAWLVHLIIYPTFAEVAPARFCAWHRNYSNRIAVVVVPLMVAQAALHAARLLTLPDARALVAAACIVAAWLVTFLGAVPCHRALSSDGCHQPVLHRLLRWNLARSLAWTLVATLTASRLVW